MIGSASHRLVSITYSDLEADVVVDVAECSKLESDKFGHHQDDLDVAVFAVSHSRMKRKAESQHSLHLRHIVDLIQSEVQVCSRFCCV